MAFFNDFGRKLSESSRNAIQKTRDLADISRLDAAVAERERSLTEVYARIGELYVQLHNNDFEPDFADEMEAVAREKDSIAALKTKIMELRGTTLCVNCGAEIPASALFCEDCGARQRYAEEMTVCPGCGQTIPAGSRFCPYCGMPLDKAPDSDETEETEGIL